MRISLIVDNPKRDLKGLSLLGYELVKLGHQVYLTPMNLLRFEIERIKPDMVVLSGYRRTTYKRVKMFKDMGLQIGILETEGGFMYNEDLLESRIEINPDSDRVIDLFFAWGEKYKQIVLKYTPIREEKIHVLGNPRFEINRVVNKKEKILFSPNFSFLKKGELEKEFVRRLKDKTGVDVSFNFDGFDKHYSYFLGVVRKVAERYPGRVVYRPHPFDDMKYLREQLQGAEIEFDENLAVSDTLKDCVACIHNSSTTGFEALLYGVPSIIPREVNSNFRSKEIDKMSFILKSDTDLFDHLDRAIENKLEIRDEFMEALNDVCNIKVNSALEIAKVIDENTYHNEWEKIGIQSDLLPSRKRYKRFLKSVLKGKVDLKLLRYSYYDQWYGSYKEYVIEDVEYFLKNYRQTDVGLRKVKDRNKVASIEMSESK